MTMSQREGHSGQLTRPIRSSFSAVAASARWKVAQSNHARMVNGGEPRHRDDDLARFSELLGEEIHGDVRVGRPGVGHAEEDGGDQGGLAELQDALD